jgi:hypothetical protein
MGVLIAGVEFLEHFPGNVTRFQQRGRRSRMVSVQNIAQSEPPLKMRSVPFACDIRQAERIEPGRNFAAIK